MALEGAALISEALPRVLDDGSTVPHATRFFAAPPRRERRSRARGLALGHAMAQAIGGRYGLPHGALNAICLPPALRFNEEFVPGELLGGRAAERAQELARFAGFTTLSALGVPEADLPELAATRCRPRGRAGQSAGGSTGRRAGAAHVGLLATANQ